MVTSCLISMNFPRDARASDHKAKRRRIQGSGERAMVALSSSLRGANLTQINEAERDASGLNRLVLDA